MNRLLDGAVSEVVRSAIRHPTLLRRHPTRTVEEAQAIVIAPVLHLPTESADLRSRRAAKFPADNYERFLQEPACSSGRRIGEAIAGSACQHSFLVDSWMSSWLSHGCPGPKKT